MKKLILTVFSILSISLLSFGQSSLNKVISTLPAKGNGYLILNQFYNVNISKWQISITDNVNGSNQTIYRKTLSGTNFDFIPSRLYSSTAQIHVVGLDQTGRVLADDIQYMNGQPITTTCYGVCEGPDYIYQLSTIQTPNSGYKMIMEQPYDSPASGLTYYYEWFKAADFASNGPLGPQNPNAHGLLNFNTVNNSENITQEYIIEYYLSPTDQFGSPQYFRNRFDDPINGELVGVIKWYGPYHDVYEEMETDVLTNDYCETYESFQFAVDAFNNHASNAPMDLECHAVYNGNSDDPDLPDANPCFENYTEILGGSAVSSDGGYNWTIWTFEQTFTVPCFEYNLGVGLADVDGGVSGGTGFNWPESVAAINFTPVSNDPGVSTTTTTYIRSNYFDNNGNFTGGTFDIPKGLLRLSYNLQNGTNMNHYVYNSDVNTSTLTQSDFVSYVAYPVPVVDNSFNFNLNATQKVDFNLELRNEEGVLVYSNRYSIGKDRTISEVINPENGFENGSYFCKLKFSDNSQINFQIIK